MDIGNKACGCNKCDIGCTGANICGGPDAVVGEGEDKHRANGGSIVVVA